MVALVRWEKASSLVLFLCRSEYLTIYHKPAPRNAIKVLKIKLSSHACKDDNPTVDLRMKKWTMIIIAHKAEYISWNLILSNLLIIR
jgi:hypothetical protein